MISTERKLAISAIPGMIAGYFLSLPVAWQAMAILMTLDFASGTIVAWSRDEHDAEINRKGIVRKAMAIILVCAVHYLSKGLQMDSDLSSMLAGWFCVTETISIAENAKKAGWALPGFLTRILMALKDKSDPIDTKKGDQ